MVRLAYRLPLLFFLAFLHVLHCVLGRAVVRGPRARRRCAARLSALYARLGLRVMNVRVDVVHGERARRLTRTLIVSNHFSYLDILVLYAVHPAVFVATTDLRAIPIVGTLCDVAGTVFVERRARKNLVEEVEQIVAAFDDGLPLIVFPEGGIQNGEAIRPFKPAYFEAALRAGADLVTVCVEYPEVEDRPIDLVSRDRICWHNDAAFFPHLFGSFRVARIRSVVTVVDRRPLAKGEHRRDVARKAEELVRSIYRPIR